MGGPTAEREISLKSRRLVPRALRARAPRASTPMRSIRVIRDRATDRAEFDRAFIALHGRFGEDGTVRGRSSISDSVHRQRRDGERAGDGQVAHQTAVAGRRHPPADELLRPDRLSRRRRAARAAVDGEAGARGLEHRHEQSDDAGKTAAGIELAVRRRQHHRRAFHEGIELTASILDDEPLPLIKLETPRCFYDYEAKYSADDTRYICPCGLPEPRERAIQEQALASFRLLGCAGWGRVDLMLSNAGTPAFLEVNTVPGMTDHSLVPMAARARGMSFEDLVLRILESAHVG